MLTYIVILSIDKDNITICGRLLILNEIVFIVDKI